MKMSVRRVRALSARRFFALILAVIVITAVTLFICILFGSQIGFSDSLTAFLYPREASISQYQIIYEFRLPRVILAAIVGAALSVAGVTFQAILRNPLAEPYILGISSGSALGAVVAIFTGASFALAGFSTISIFSFAGSILTTAIVYLLASGRGHEFRYNFILTGVIVGAFLSAFVLLLTATLRHNDLPRVVFWLMGNLGTPLEDFPLGVISLYVIAGSALLFAASRSFNAIMLGDEAAFALGCNPARLRSFAFLLGSLIVSAAVSVSGLVGFVGLIVPHTVRLALGSDHRILLPASFFAGAAFLAAADTLARSILPDRQIPVGVVTALCGAPVFLILMRTRMRKSYFG
jgi:iron complex transport system permease protein